MLILDPKDEMETRYAIHRAVRESGVSLKEISERLDLDYGVTLSEWCEPLYKQRIH